MSSAKPQTFKFNAVETVAMWREKLFCDTYLLYISFYKRKH